MQNSLRTSKAAYETLVRTLSRKESTQKEPSLLCTSAEELEAAYAVYKNSIPSEKTMHRVPRFKALTEAELSDDDMLYGVAREQAEKDLEKALQGFAMPEDAGSWFWQSPNDSDLVVLRSWVEKAA